MTFGDLLDAAFRLYRAHFLIFIAILAEKEQKLGRHLLVVLMVLFVVLCALFSSPVSAQSQAPDLPTYAGWVREAFAAAQRSDRIGLEQVASRLANTRSVSLPGGPSIAVDNSWLRQVLEAEEPDMSAIEARLGAILDALAQPNTSAPADALERLRALLGKPPFAQAGSSEGSWWNDFWAWVLRLLGSLLRPIGMATQPAGEAIGWAVLAVGGLLLAGLIGYVLRGLRRSMAADASIAADDPAAGLTARTALDQAGDIARGGDYRTAMRYLYLSALLWLDERDLLRYDRALTNREYLERLRDNAALRERLRPIVETFDRVWYGHAALDAEGFAAYRAHVEALRDVKG
jgi:hypothetical protein